MILDFSDIGDSELGEVLWDSFISSRLWLDETLLAVTPREWDNQDEETKELWKHYAHRLCALYEMKEK